jgi:3-hydroxyisobutyrate dehydrogenase-like beta-hydroxyacid dehydrogenase
MSDAHMSSPTVAVIGVGEMGAAVGRRLRECGARVLTSLNGRSASSAERVRRAGLEVVEDDDCLVRDANFVLSIVPPGVAVEVAERLRGPLLGTQSRAAFIECNAIAPATSRRIAVMLGATNFIDAGIIGGPPRLGTQDPAQGPRFYASGSSAALLNQLVTFGLDIAVLDGPVGAASGLKLAYAGLTKGLTALGAAMINAAARDGLDDALRTELARTQQQLLGRLEQYVPQMFPKAYRWVAEMEQIAEFVGSPAEGADIYKGVARLYEAIADPGAPDAPARRQVERLTRFCGRSA